MMKIVHTILVNQLTYSIVISSAIASLLLTPSQVLAKNVGVIECSGIQEGSPQRKYNIQSAALENAKNGFTLILTVKGWKSKGWVSGDRVVYPVAPDLKVYDVDYHNDGQTDTTLDIKRSGQFKYVAMPSSRSICLTKGTLTFGNGVKQKLFR
jgi:hypothetical protein